MSAIQSLALTLAWTQTRGLEPILCMLFGVTGTVYSLFIRFGRRIIVCVLAHDSNVAVRLPEEVRTYQQAIGKK